MAQLTEQQQQEIEAAILGGKKIEAIKLYREASGTGLKEAKDWVEELERQLRFKQPEKSSALPKKAGCFGMVMAVVFALGATAFVLMMVFGR
ncbi:MAG: ribosomal protein L7/L12 [Verrucomicrobia bacterium]|nr:ribosomal protein L7/L12 [Verrucomicrobiota bacterium]